jgi:hypothetical protein
MNVTAAMIEFVLLKRGFDVRVIGNPNLEIDHIALFRESAREQGALYIVDEKNSRKSAGSKESYALLYAQTSENPASFTQTMLLEEAFSALRELDAWDAKLKDALLQRVSLEEFVRLGSAMFTCPIAYFDRNLITLAATDGYWERGDDSLTSIAEQMPSELAMDLVEDLDYLNAAAEPAGFYYKSAQGRIFYGVNTFDHGEYFARLVFALPADSNRLHPGEEQIIALYHRYLDDLHLHYGGNVDVVSTQNDALHTLIRSIVIDNRQPIAGESDSVLTSFGWSSCDTFTIVKLVFFEGVHWNSISLYLCGLLERAMAASCAFPIEQQIVWLIDLSRSSHANETTEQTAKRLIETLVAIMRGYACKTGLSDQFKSLQQAREYYIEAVRALDRGQNRDPHLWYYRFSDYAFDYLLAKETEELSAEQTCHPALSKLIAYDIAHGSEYARTLVCFLRNNQSTTHAANELYIHRTSFMRRMAQIQKLAPVDLDNPDEVLHLLLSAKLLGM